MRRTLTTPGCWRRCSLRTIEARNHCIRIVGLAGVLQVLENWSSVFEGVPDFTSELVASAVDGDTEWGEWSWRGHHVDGSSFAMRGVTIFVMRDGLVTEGRLYMEPVEAGGGDIAAAVEELYRPPSAAFGLGVVRGLVPSDSEGCPRCRGRTRLR